MTPNEIMQWSAAALSATFPYNPTTEYVDVAAEE